MLSRFLEMKEAVISALTILDARLNIISGSEWIVLEQAKHILGFFLHSDQRGERWTQPHHL